jgi:anaerobic dimethyl sulfoxide reductase subunit B (iron-sulfur subunit)
MAYGLLFDYEYCTNCGSCQVTCQEEHDYPVSKTGIKVFTDGPWKIDDEYWNFNNWPVVTDLCDLCADRTAKGREPMCVHHCLSNIITYGTVEELSKKLAEKPKQFLVVPQYNPLASKEEFVSKNQHIHKAAHIEVEGTGKASYAVHRHDAKVGELDENEGTVM